MLTTVILAPGACRTQGMTCFGCVRFQWKVADALDPVDPVQHSGRLDSMRLRGTSADVAKNPGPIPLKSKNSLGGSPGRGLDNIYIYK